MMLQKNRSDICQGFVPSKKAGQIVTDLRHLKQIFVWKVCFVYDSYTAFGMRVFCLSYQKRKDWVKCKPESG